MENKNKENTYKISKAEIREKVKLIRFILENNYKEPDIYKRIKNKYSNSLFRVINSEFKMTNNGMTIMQYLKHIRFNKLIELLLNKNDTRYYYELADKIGLSDEKYVYRLVKSKTGKTIREFHIELLNKKRKFKNVKL